jgi:hypothetical protein
MNKKKYVLTELQRALSDLLIMQGVQGNALVGTMLLLKESVPDQEEMILYLWYNNPTPEEINEKLIEIVMRRPLSQRMGNLSESSNNSK